MEWRVSSSHIVFGETLTWKQAHMPGQNRSNADADNMEFHGGNPLVTAILAGVVAGTGANIAALLLGQGFFSALLWHSLIGAMAFFLALFHGMTKKPTIAKMSTRPERVASRVKTAHY
ncbi:hypothetical protein [Yoonia sp. SS1-5]|uniref:Uncharacterized protein n=1 Tax=Yoonia rhodophyticola TaxID=3137370 RepID=A0AAN0MCH1_9RHOB